MSMTGEGQLNADSQKGGSCHYTKYQTHHTACLLLGPEGQNRLQCQIYNLIITGTVFWHAWSISKSTAVHCIQKTGYQWQLVLLCKNF